MSRSIRVGSIDSRRDYVSTVARRIDPTG